MKITTLAKTNQKGQIVIPKQFRDALNINPEIPLQIILRGHGMYIYPVKEVITKGEYENLYPNILEKTKGAWSKENWHSIRRKRKRIELTASKKRKHEW